jgi:hypothetical protein
MKVGIITIHNHHNYGAVLQAYALNRTVRHLGHQCQTIDCDMDPESGRVFRWTRYPGAMIPNLYIALNKNACKRHDRRFRDFGQQHIPRTEIKYDTLEQMIDSPPRFEAYITGSDQVWRPSLLERKIGEAFHLSFADPDRSKLIAYAPSFGVSQIPATHAPKIAAYLQRYHHLSAREKRGRELIQELAGRDAAQVLDPTLLLDIEEYKQILQPPTLSDEYLLLYPMELGHNLGFLELVKKVKKLLSLPVVCVLPLQFSYQWLTVADTIILDAGPQEFLGLFSNASFVCTNSFHGTVFSILFRKNFLGFPHSGSNTRIHSLLELTGLLCRQTALLDPHHLRQLLDSPIDYDEVRPFLQRSIDHSLQYLKDALSA